MLPIWCVAVVRHWQDGSAGPTLPALRTVASWAAGDAGCPEDDLGAGMAHPVPPSLLRGDERGAFTLPLLAPLPLAEVPPPFTRRG